MKKNNKLLAFICAAATAASGLTLSMPYNVFAIKVLFSAALTGNAKINADTESHGKIFFFTIFSPSFRSFF